MFATNKGLHQFQIASDSQSLINIIKTKTQHREIYEILHDISFFSTDLGIINFVFVQRDRNLIADGLAKSTLHNVSVYPILMKWKTFDKKKSLQNELNRLGTKKIRLQNKRNERVHRLVISIKWAIQFYRLSMYSFIGWSQR